MEGICEEFYPYASHQHRRWAGRVNRGDVARLKSAAGQWCGSNSSSCWIEYAPMLENASFKPRERVHVRQFAGCDEAAQDSHGPAAAVASYECPVVSFMLACTLPELCAGDDYVQSPVAGRSLIEWVDQ
jgi:hypothetical protein